MKTKLLQATYLFSVVAAGLTHEQRLIAQDPNASNTTTKDSVATHATSIRLTPIANIALTSSATHLAFSPNGARIAVGGDLYLAVYDTTTLKCVHTVDVPDGVSSVTFSHDNLTVYATIEGNCELRWWGLAPGVSDGVWRGDICSVFVAFATGELLATGSDKIMLLNPSTGKQKTIVETDDQAYVGSPFIDADGSAITFKENRDRGDQPHWIRRIDFTNKTMHERRSKIGANRIPGLYPCGDRFVYCLNWEWVPGKNAITEAEVWGGPDFKRLRTIRIPDSDYIRTGVCVGGDLFCVGGQPAGDNPFKRGATGFFAIVDVTTGAMLHREKTEIEVRRLSFSEKTKLLAALVGEHEIHIWKLHTN